MSNTFGRVVAVTALVVGPLSLIAGNIAQWLLQPAGIAPTATDAAAQFPAAWLTIALLGVFGPIVWLAGIPATAALAPGRGSLVTRIGALITGAGLAAGIGHVALFFGLYGALAQAGLDTGAAGAMEAAADQDVLGNILLYAFLIGFSLGPIVLTVGLRIAGALAVWVPIAAVITAGANLFGGPIAGVVQLVALVLVWAPIAISVARNGGQTGATRRDTPDALIPQEI
jgi:hypothetical protein